MKAPETQISTVIFISKLETNDIAGVGVIFVRSF